MSMTILPALALFAACASAHSADQWKARTIYQLLTDRFAAPGQTSACGNLQTYCGGTFAGIVQKLDYIADLGFDAIWISPVVANTPNGYHGYWAQDIYAINSNFGSAADLQQLVTACHQRDIWVMLDVVANHMGNQQNNNDDFSMFNPFNSSSFYHPYCIINNWNNQTEVELCRLAGLPDLAQENPAVTKVLVEWVQSTVQTFGFDGIRVDTVPEVKKDFWAQYAQAAGVYSVGEVDNGDPTYVAPYQGSLDATLAYPMYWTLRHVFQDKSSPMTTIDAAITQYRQLFQDTSILASFLDNHDNPRFLNLNNNHDDLINALAFNFFADGIPIMYYGTEQEFNGGNDPENREDLWRSGYGNSSHVYGAVQAMLSFRKSLPGNFFLALMETRFVDDSLFAFTRDQVLVVTTNTGSSSPRTIINLPYPDGTLLVNVLNGNQQYTVNNGQIVFAITNGAPFVAAPAQMS